MARPKKQDEGAPFAHGASNEAPNTNASHGSGGARGNAAAEAFAKLEAEIAAVAITEVGGVGDVSLGIEPAVTLAIVLAAAPRIREHRAEIELQLPKHPIGCVDKLESYAQAAFYAHLVHTYASTGPEGAKALVDEATRLREGLIIAAEALAHRALLDVDAVARIRKGGAHPDVGGDLLTLAALFKDSWGKVSSKTAVERSEVDRAAELGPAVVVAHDASKQKDTNTELQRARAIALLLEQYDSARRAIAYLRWKEGDVDTIAPSLLKKRPGRKPGKKDEPAETHEAPAPEAESTGAGS